VKEISGWSADFTRARKEKRWKGELPKPASLQ